ncbi:putative salt tolerance-like protein [Platanthera guangdongensis]|uniref:Salt tolerance-like protein n=1 Tax=Platanthera guangdongensis TaxID=2320717 RepID=A0ABR2LJN7_9ASPA
MWEVCRRNLYKQREENKTLPTDNCIPLPNPLHLFRRLVGARHLATKLQCDVCGAEQASILCCADEVVLCTGCDARIHSANKLAEKHNRFSLQLRRRVHGAGIESISL